MQGQGVLLNDIAQLVTEGIRSTLRDQNRELAKMLARQRFANDRQLQMDDNRYVAMLEVLS